MKTHIKRIPPWSREEIILALDLYFRIDAYRISARSPEIVRLSSLLRNLSVCSSERSSSYKNPTGVYMKLMNLYSIENPGKELLNDSRLDREIYFEFCNKKDYLHAVADEIIRTIV